MKSWSSHIMVLVFFSRVTPGFTGYTKTEPLVITGADLLQAKCHSCHPTNDVNAQYDFMITSRYIIMNTNEKCSTCCMYYKTNYHTATNYLNASENDSTAHFVMQYGAAYGMLKRPRILDILTIRLPRHLVISGRNTRTTRHMPNTLTSNSRVMCD